MSGPAEGPGRGTRRRRPIPPNIRRLDPRYLRVGAGISAALLAGATVLGLHWLVLLDTALLAVSAVLGTDYWILSRPWSRLRKRLNAPMVRIVPDLPYRFSQAGAVLILLAALLVMGLSGLSLAGWGMVAAVVAVQALHAASGLCLGCRAFEADWVLPDLFTALAVRTTIVRHR